MYSKIHAIVLDPSKCVGCTNCLKRCPTEAIRVKSGHSKIVKERCINCGQCIQACPRHARYGSTGDLDQIHQYPYKIALVDPVLYGQFHEVFTPGQILKGILKLGFDSFFEISQGADLINELTLQIIPKAKKLPIISSSCPTIVRLIQLRFPDLIDHILSIDSPVEISAQLARKKAIAEHGLKEEDIGVFYISPCPARIFSFERPVGIEKSQVSGTLSVKQVFLTISKEIDRNSDIVEDYYRSGMGIGWARSGGQSYALGIKEFLAVDGIQNVISVLEEIEYHKIRDLVFLECHACTNGCVGGSLTLENSFVARNRIRRLAEQHGAPPPLDPPPNIKDFQLTEPLKPLSVIQLDEDISKAIEKMDQIERVLKTLPNIDCGACGSPSCRALAEDVVLGFAHPSDCIVKLKHRLKQEQ